MSGPCLYIFSEGPEGPCKIGWAKDPESRFKTLQTGNPRPMKLEWFRDDCPEAPQWEHAVHVELSAKRLKGEWFAVTPAEAEAAVSVVMERGLPRHKKYSPRSDDTCHFCGGTGKRRYASPAERQRAYRERKRRAPDDQPRGAGPAGAAEADD